MGGNHFYSNAEAYALEVLQQRFMKEAQRSAQNNMMELSALRSFLGQGQFFYCIPFGGCAPPGPPPMFPGTIPTSPLPFQYYPMQDCGYVPTPTPNYMDFSPPCHPPATRHYNNITSPCHNPYVTSTNPAISGHHRHHHGMQSTLQVKVKNANLKNMYCKPGSDECNLGKDGIELTIDLREYLPAEICLDVEEKTVEVKANHLDTQCSRTFSRRYDLPACIILDTVRCILSHDGYLLFSAAWCKME